MKTSSILALCAFLFIGLPASLALIGHMLIGDRAAEVTATEAAGFLAFLCIVFLPVMIIILIIGWANDTKPKR